MKRLLFPFLLSFAFCAAEEVTLTKSAILKADHSAVSVKAGTTVELLSRGEKTLTVRYNKLTGTIPASCVAPLGEEKKKEETGESTGRKAQTSYGKAVEKAKENAAKHDKNVVKPTDEILK
jgi:hypothetical protein